MRTIALIALLSAASASASAQVVHPPLAVDPDAIATKAQVSALAAQIPVPSTSAPPAEVVGGALGSQMVFRRADDIQPRISRSVTGVTVTGGAGAVSWPAMPGIPRLTVTPYVAAGAVQAPMCFPVAGTVTTTGATIKCFTSQSVTVSLLGAVVAPVTTAAAGVTFDVLALPGS